MCANDGWPVNRRERRPYTGSGDGLQTLADGVREEPPRVCLTCIPMPPFFCSSGAVRCMRCVCETTTAPSSSWEMTLHCVRRTRRHRTCRLAKLGTTPTRRYVIVTGSEHNKMFGRRWPLLWCNGFFFVFFFFVLFPIERHGKNALMSVLNSKRQSQYICVQMEKCRFFFNFWSYLLCVGCKVTRYFI